MRRLTRTAVFFGGSLLALAACADAAIVGNDTNELVATTPADHSVADAGPGNDKASLFRSPRETRVLLLARP